MTGQEGGKTARAVTREVHSPESRNGSSSVVYAERKCSSSLVLFFLVVVAILSSVKNSHCSRWNQSSYVIFHSLVGKCLHKDKEQEREGGSGNDGWGR